MMKKHFTFVLILLVTVMAHAQEAYLVDKLAQSSLPMTAFSETPAGRMAAGIPKDSLITAMVAAVNADSMTATLRQLQSMGSRFLMNDNNRDIATTLMNRFIAYGYTDVKLDSFYLVIQNWSGLSDSAWQYNVVCTVTGESAPEEVYIAGGHYDSFCTPDPFNNAPGVDDNGTAVAATFELARLMKLYNFHPQATIKFILYAAEELGLFGSRYSSWRSRMNGEDIRYMLNMDMISNNPENLNQVKIFHYLNHEWAGECASASVERYTDLKVMVPGNKTAEGSDSFPYWLQDYPAAYFEEIAFSPNWHKPSDTLGNCNIPYFVKVTGGALATLMEQLTIPYPQGLTSKSTAEAIALSWKPTANQMVNGYNIYRGDAPGGPYQKLNAQPVSDSVYHDLSTLPNRQHYYVISTVNQQQVESRHSHEVTGARFSFHDSLLVISCNKGTRITPDSIRDFYTHVLDTIPHVWRDVNTEHPLSYADLTRYRSILWMTNSIEFEFLTPEAILAVNDFSANKGNLLFAGFSPGRYWNMTNILYPLKVQEGSLLERLFKVDTVDRKSQSMMNRAYAVADGYSELRIDSLKSLDPKYPGQIFMIDVLAPRPGATVIHRFDTKYDSVNVLGKMKHRPVGIEYMGEDHKSILLSFPLYYTDSSDARKFLGHVMKSKFNAPVSSVTPVAADPIALQIFPNPATDACNVAFRLERPSKVKIRLISSTGATLAVWLNMPLGGGDHQYRFPLSGFPTGFYEVTAETGTGISVRKLITIR